MTAIIMLNESRHNEYRRVPMHLVQSADGVTPATAENGGQPQRSQFGVAGTLAFTNSAGLLVAVSNGLYYVELSAAEVNLVGMGILRYKSANTLEAQADYQVVAYDPYSGPWQTIGGVGVVVPWVVYDTTPGKPVNTPNPNVSVTVNQSTVGPNVAPVASGVTDATGTVTFVLPTGTYQFWQFKAGFNFTNPIQVVVS